MSLSETLDKYQLPLAALSGYVGGKWIERNLVGYAVNLVQAIRERRTETNGGHSIDELRIYKMLENFDKRLGRIEEDLKK